MKLRPYQENLINDARQAYRRWQLRREMERALIARKESRVVHSRDTAAGVERAKKHTRWTRTNAVLAEFVRGGS